MLDFGSGSGVLSIAAARLGATVDAVEIDEKAILHARRNVADNALEDRITQHTSLADVTGTFDLIVANILSAVLLSFAEDLVGRSAPGSVLVLSGLVSTDTPALSVRYAALMAGARPEIYERGEWRGLVWRRKPA